MKDAKYAVLPGYDQTTGTEDDLIARLENGNLKAVEFPDRSQEMFDKAAAEITRLAKEQENRLPAVESIRAGQLGKDLWGNEIEYSITSQNACRLISAGPDGKKGTAWDMGLTITIRMPEGEKKASWMDRFRPQESWLERRMREKGVSVNGDTSVSYEVEYFSGGQSKLEGQSYFRFFTILMLVFALLYVPFAMVYRPKSYLA
jgi:proton-dependent oligopeptide transporter, POT family